MSVTCELSMRPNNPHYAVFCFTCMAFICSAGLLNNAYYYYLRTYLRQM